MKRILSSAAAAAVLVFPALALAAPVTYEIDPAHSNASFSVRHLAVSNVRGMFKNVQGTIVIDDQNIANSRAEATIDATTIDTNEPKRDAHLKSADFFDVERYPKITFKSKSWKPGSEKGTYQVSGDLTIRGVTKEVVLDVDELTPEVKDPYGNVKRGISATTKINRKDYGLKWNALTEAGGVVVGDEVKIDLELELLRKDKTPAPAKATDPTR